MNALARFARFWWDFVVGDDWRVSVAVVAALIATWALSDRGIAAWWLLPLATALVFVLSIRREVRDAA